MAQLQTDVTNPYERKQGGNSKWRNKRHDKKGKNFNNKDDQTAQQPPQLGCEAIYKKVHALPTPLLELLSVFKEESRSLVDDMEVSFMCDPILVKGRYVKLTRDVSQTPWALNEDDDDDTKPQ